MRPASKAVHGWSLAETLIALCVVATLASLALPALHTYIRRAHRLDAIAHVAQMELALERWRSWHTSYDGARNVDGRPFEARTPDGRYRIDLHVEPVTSGSGYDIAATATGAQSGDRPCGDLRARMAAGTLLHASGDDEAVSNGEAANRRCWGLP